MFKNIAVIIAILLVVIMGYAATKPNKLTVERSIKINASSAKIFPLINDLKQWQVWSPWEKMDVNMKRIYSESSQGKGATYTWDGNHKVGKGRIEIINSIPSSAIDFKLSFEKPFRNESNTQFRLVGTGGKSTDVTWIMQCHRNYLMKLMSVFLNYEKMVGRDFENGLANLKEAVEKNDNVQKDIKERNLSDNK